MSTTYEEVWPLRAKLSRATCQFIGAGGIVVMLALILVANWAVSTFGFVPVGFGVQATAGVYFAGFTLAFRDLVQDALGRKWVVIVIAAGALLSWLIAAPAVALASGVSFFLAELADFAVYTPIRERARFGGGRWAVAVVGSNIVGAMVDSVVFIWIAFGGLAVQENFVGQMVGKGWATGVYLLLGYFAARFVFDRMKVKETSNV